MILSRYSLGQFGALCGGMAALLVAVKFADYIVSPSEPEAELTVSSSQYQASFERRGEVRGDTIPNLILSAQGKELRLGEMGSASVTVPAGQTEGRLRVSALSTGTDLKWVKEHSRMPFVILTGIDRSAFAFDGRDIVFKNLAPGAYKVEMGLWLKSDGQVVSEKKSLGAGSRNCEAYKKSHCVFAVGAPTPLTLGNKAGPERSLAGKALGAVADIPFKTPFLMFAGLFLWRSLARRALRAAASFLSPGLVQHLGALPASDVRERPQLERWLSKRS